MDNRMRLYHNIVLSGVGFVRLCRWLQKYSK